MGFLHFQKYGPAPGPASPPRSGFSGWLSAGLFSGKPAGVAMGLSDILFFLSFAFCFGWEFLNTTMFKKGFSDAFEMQMEACYHGAVLAALLCGLVAVLLQDSLRQAAFEAALVAAGFLHWKAGAGKYSFFVLCVLLVGMTGRSCRALLSIALSIGTAMMAAAFVASQTGVIEDLVYEGGRHSFGIIYCTDCAAHLLYLLIMYAWLRLDRLGLVEYVAMALVWALILMTRAQSDTGCAALLMAGLLAGMAARAWKKRAGDGKLPASAPGEGPGQGGPAGAAHGIVDRLLRGAGAAACFSWFFFAALSFVVTLGFDRGDRELRKKIPYSFIRRLEMNQEALAAHPFSLFGSSIEEHGFGGRTQNLPGWDKYFFLDSSFIRLYVIGGALLFVLVLLVMTYAQLRLWSRRRYGLVFLLALVAASCFMEHHLMEYFYNVFPLLAFADLGDGRPAQDPVPVGRPAEAADALDPLPGPACADRE